MSRPTSSTIPHPIRGRNRNSNPSSAFSGPDLLIGGNRHDQGYSAATEAEEYRNTAEILRDLAAQARFGTTRNELFNYAANLDRLASLAEQRSQVTSERFAPLSDGSVRTQDGNRVRIGFGQDPGQAGKSQAQHLVRALSGFTVNPASETGDKLTRFGPFSSQCRADNIKILRGAWNEELFRVLEGFPDLAHDDEVDACSGTLEMLNPNAELGCL